MNMFDMKYKPFEIEITTGYNNVLLLKRPGSDMGILSADTENHFNNCVCGGDSKMKQDGGDDPKGIRSWT